MTYTTPRIAKAKPGNQRKLTKKGIFVKSLIREVVGFSPYEKRIMELLKNSKDKRAKKFAKQRLGTLRRAKRKVDELTDIIQSQRRKQEKHE